MEKICIKRHAVFVLCLVSLPIKKTKAGLHQSINILNEQLAHLSNLIVLTISPRRRAYFMYIFGAFLFFLPESAASVLRYMKSPSAEYRYYLPSLHTLRLVTH